MADVQSQPSGPAEERRLYIKVGETVADLRASVEEALAIRNLFAFLGRQFLVASPGCPSPLDVLLKVAANLEAYEFANADKSTFGEVVVENFDHYVVKLGLADMRRSRQKTIEALILGERMRCWDLYKEAFAHSVGNYEALLRLEKPLFDRISAGTRNWLERELSELQKLVKSANERLTDFELPSLFAGVANSVTSDESKNVNFRAWKNAFFAFRRYLLSYLRHKYGAWPPRARGKNHNFEEGGLNRIVLQSLYHDMTNLYDLLVDRTLYSPRVFGSAGASPTEPSGPEEPIFKALRLMMTEFDHSSPPVVPPVPYDVPKLPVTPVRHATASSGESEIDRERTRRLNSEETGRVLAESYNADSLDKSPFVSGFQAFERKSAHGKSVAELCDQRVGYWILVYAVIQALPLLVVDVPGLKSTEGVEYFLCRPPKRGRPWMPPTEKWYQVSHRGTVVKMNDLSVEYSVDAAYSRSHCWLAAVEWEEVQNPDVDIGPMRRRASSDDATTTADDADDASDAVDTSDTVAASAAAAALAPSRPPSSPSSPQTPQSPQQLSMAPLRPRRRSYRQSVVSLPLEAIPLAQGVHVDVDAPPIPPLPAQGGTGKTFKDILPDTPSPPPKKKWRFTS